MTIIGAKVVKWKWNLFSDDCVSIGEYKISARQNYRSKIRELPRAPRKILVATAWSCRQVDLIVNNIDKALSRLPDCIDEYDIKDLLQESVIDVIKCIKEIDDENYNWIILLLDTDFDNCYLIEWYAVNQLERQVEYAWGSWDDTFYRIHKINSSLDSDDKYITDFRLASKDAPWCWWNVFQVNWDWEMIYEEIK